MRKQRANLIDLTNKKYGRLTVVGYSGIDKHQKRRWDCICSCGNKTNVATTPLLLGKVQSCGCLKIELKIKHGDSDSLEYFAWRSMRNRCTSSTNPFYDKYGGRGIKICERWSDYNNFLFDMGRKPTKLHSLERIDNDGDYTPENCKWATKSEQTRNRRITIKIKHDGKEMLIQEWAKELGFPYSTLYMRLRNGWSIDRAFNTQKKGL